MEKDDRPPIVFSQSVISLLRKMQTNLNPQMSSKSPNRTTIYMGCLEELVDFVTKKLDAE